MTILEDIQQSAVDADSDLSTLLRKCKVLAARLGSPPLQDWLVWESNGYPDEVDVPDYRSWPLQVRGHFVGLLGRELRYWHIPLACIPAPDRQGYERWECRWSVGAVEIALEKVKGQAHLDTADLAVSLGTKVIEGANCIAAWAEFSPAHLIELLNTVRNRILDFALAVWKEAPTAGDADAQTAPPMGTERVTQIFNTTVYGGSANMVGVSNASSIVFNVEVGNFASLRDVLLGSGLSEDDVQDLRAAIDSEPSAHGGDGFGPGASAWIGRMLEKAATGAWQIGLSGAASLLAQAIARYYGQ